MNARAYLNIRAIEERVLRVAVGKAMLRLTKGATNGEKKEKRKNEKQVSHYLTI
jgi:hypothetical protein